MRPIEILQSVANVLTFFALAIPRLHAARWTGYVAPIALLLAIAQVLIEGPRWQMAPAYVLTGLFFLLKLLGAIAPAGGLAPNRLSISMAVGLVSPLASLKGLSGPLDAQRAHSIINAYSLAFEAFKFDFGNTEINRRRTDDCQFGNHRVAPP
jgi:hypothetical protein